ncbi:hypothetical protein B7463_g2570, partial [Scytalidium lignicola]
MPPLLIRLGIPTLNLQDIKVLLENIQQNEHFCIECAKTLWFSPSDLQEKDIKDVKCYHYRGEEKTGDLIPIEAFDAFRTVKQEISSCAGSSLSSKAINAQSKRESIVYLDTTPQSSTDNQNDEAEIVPAQNHFVDKLDQMVLALNKLTESVDNLTRIIENKVSLYMPLPQILKIKG